MKILSFESSCDETSAAVVEYDNGFFVRSDIVASQIDIHARYGGVVPEIASRAHCETISKITYEALEKAETPLSEINAVAVTSNPGLIGALLVGVNFAKSLAYANNIPLISVNHIKGHICANYLSHPDLKPPFIAFVASGGHTSIIRVSGYNEYETIGGTRDDAMGEAFDKVARVLGMPYPGGRAMDELAYKGKANIVFPSAALRDSLDFSFSGIKTAVLNYINSKEQKCESVVPENIAASFVRTAVKSVITKLGEVFEGEETRSLCIAGGVAANSHLRDALTAFCRSRGIKLFLPELKYCGDNAAMIAAAGYFEFISGDFAGTSLNASAISV